MKSIPPKELAVLLKNEGDALVLDVRTPAEYYAEHAEGAVNLPLDQLGDGRIVSLGSKDKPVYLLCQRGNRAAKAAHWLSGEGWKDPVNVEGGTDAWADAGLPVVQTTVPVIGLERQVRIAAGTLVLLGVGFGFWLHPAAFGLAAFVGAGLVFAGITDWCGMGLLLAKAPWNQYPRN